MGGPQAAIAPVLGLASETGAILNVYKKYLRGGIDLGDRLPVIDIHREDGPRPTLRFFRACRSGPAGRLP